MHNRSRKRNQKSHNNRTMRVRVAMEVTPKEWRIVKALDLDEVLDDGPIELLGSFGKQQLSA